jgi:hypoxia up-regulated 1
VRLTDLEKEQDKDKKWTKRVTVFKKNNKMGSNKVVAFQHTRDFSCAFNYDNKESLPQGTSSQISVYNVSGVEDFVASLQKKNVTGKPKVHLSFKLDSSGLVHLVKAEATLIQMVQPKIEEPDANTTNSNSTQFNGTKSEDQAANATESESSNATNSTGNETVAIKEPPKPTKKTHRSVLTVIRTDTNITFKKMSDEERKDIIDALREMDHQDDLRKEKAAAKNNLEAFMYESKDKLNTNEEDVSKVTTEDQRSGILQELEDTDEWLYGDGDDLPAADYKEKQRALGKKVDAIFARVTEFTERPKAVDKLQNKMQSSLNLISTSETSKPQITAMEREEVFNITTKLGAWLEEKQALQGKLESHEEPAFTAKEALIKMRPLNAIISRLSKRPKPIPKAIPRPTNATDSSNSTNATNTSEGTDAGNETKTVETETSDAESDKTEEDDSSKEEL